MALYIFLGVSIVVTILSNLIQYQYQVSSDFAEYLIDDYGWINILSCVGGSAIVAGFIFWSWKIMLIIVASLVVVGAFVGLIIWKLSNRDFSEEDESYEEIISSSKSVFKCKNCGASLLKQLVETDEGRKTRYLCEHCGVSGSLKEIRQKKTDEKIEEIEINDFEEEYFDACIVMGFRPHNRHTQKQIDRKYDKLMNQIEEDEITFEEDDRDDEDILDEAYAFFSDNVDEIDEYLTKETEENIRKKFDYYNSEED